MACTGCVAATRHTHDPELEGHRPQVLVLLRSPHTAARAAAGWLQTSADGFTQVCALALACSAYCPWRTVTVAAVCLVHSAPADSELGGHRPTLAWSLRSCTRKRGGADRIQGLWA